MTGLSTSTLLSATLSAVCSAETVEIDAPGILDRPHTTYVLTRDVTAARTAFVIKGDHITLDLGGHRVTYGTAVGVDRCSGVFLRPGGGEDSFKGVPKEGFGGGNHFADPERKLYVYAGEDQRRKIGETATLAGTVKVVGAGEPQVTWRQVGGPQQLAIAGPSSANARVTMAAWGAYTFEIEAKLGDETAKDQVRLRADAKLTPQAVALAPKTATVNTIVQLDATKSTDPRRFPSDQVKYVWTQISGPEAILSSNEWPDPIFYPTEPGTYVFELTVSNPIRTSQPARCSVTVMGSEGEPQ